MSKATAVIPFDSGVTTESPSFELVQTEYATTDPDGFEDWLTETGRNVTGAALFAAYNQYISGCDDEGDLCTALRVRLSDISLPYTLKLTWGDLDAPLFVEETRQEYVKFELDTEASVDFGTITSAVWSGAVEDEDAEIITGAEPPTISGRTLTYSQKVYGVAEVTVVEQLFEYPVTISPRTPTDAQLASDDYLVDELYASTAKLFCDSRIELHDIKMPDDFGTCSGGYGGTSVQVPDDEPTDEITYNVMISDIFDYCSGSPITGATVYVDGILVVGESVLLVSGEHTIKVTADGYTDSDEDELTENDTFTLP